MPSHREQIGAKIRQERLARNMSIDELAEMLHLSTAFIGLIERGQRGAKLSNLIKIADIFGLTVNDLVYDTSPTPARKLAEPKPENPLQVKRSTISSILYDLNEAEMDFVIATIRSLKDMRRALNPMDYTFTDDEDDELE